MSNGRVQATSTEHTCSQNARDENPNPDRFPRSQVSNSLKLQVRLASRKLLTTWCERRRISVHCCRHVLSIAQRAAYPAEALRLAVLDVERRKEVVQMDQQAKLLAFSVHLTGAAAALSLHDQDNVATRP